MKSKIISIALSVVALALLSLSSIQAAEPTGPNAAVENLLKQMEDDWAAALIKADQAALDRIIAPEWSLTDTEGHLLTKAQADANLKNGVIKFESAHNDDLQVRVYGDTAIVFGLATQKGTYQGKAFSDQIRFTTVFVKRDGRWQAVASHTSWVKKK